MGDVRSARCRCPHGQLLPDYYPENKRALTVRLLMCRAAGLTSGLRLRRDTAPDSSGATHRRAAMQRFLQAPLSGASGQQTVYSDISPILIGDLLEHLGGDRLDGIRAGELYAPIDDPLRIQIVLLVGRNPARTDPPAVVSPSQRMATPGLLARHYGSTRSWIFT